MSADPDDMFVKHRDFWMVLREALLSVVDVLERKMGMYPTTSEIRRSWKSAKISAKPSVDDASRRLDIPE